MICVWDGHLLQAQPTYVQQFQIQVTAFGGAVADAVAAPFSPSWDNSTKTKKTMTRDKRSSQAMR